MSPADGIGRWQGDSERLELGLDRGGVAGPQGLEDVGVQGKEGRDGLVLRDQTVEGGGQVSRCLDGGLSNVEGDAASVRSVGGCDTRVGHCPIRINGAVPNITVRVCRRRLGHRPVRWDIGRSRGSGVRRDDGGSHVGTDGTVGCDRDITGQKSGNQGVGFGQRSSTDGDREEGDDSGDFEMHVLKRIGEDGKVMEG